VQKLAEMNATMTTLKALSVATPEVNTVVNGMIVSINTDIKPHIVTDHTDTQTLVDTTISTLSSRTTGAVEKKKAAVAADQALGQCYAEQKRLLGLNETCKGEEATLKGEKEIKCTHINLYPKTYPLPDDLKKDLTCNFSNGDCEDVRGARKNEHDTWLNGLSIVADKASYDSAHAACVAATLRWTNKIASCETMWSNVENKHAHCLYALKAQQLAICMFGDNLQSKCETKSNYDTLISDIDGTGNSDSTGDRASEWIAVNQLECMLTKFVGGAIFDNAMIADCTKNEGDAKADFEEHVGILDKKTVEYESLITEANFNCAETAITFTGDRWSVPQDVLKTHVSSAYTMVTGYEYAFDSDSDKAPFDFCASKTAHTTCGANFACGSGSRKPAETTCYVDGGCTAAACCVKVAVCGDHVLDANEECDDGNDGAGDGCSATCTKEWMQDLEWVKGASSETTTEHSGALSTVCSGRPRNCARNVMDDDQATVWHCNSLVGCSIEFDLQTARHVTGFDLLTWGGRVATALLQWSSDGSTWATSSNVSPVGDTARVMVDTTARFWRLRDIASSNTGWPGLKEVKFRIIDAA